MVSHWRRRFSYALAGLLWTGLTGCGPILVASNPDTFAVPQDAAALLRGGQSVALNNAYTEETQVKIYAGGAGWLADLKQYTETAMAMLGKEMQKKGIAVAPQSAKSVTLRVYDVQASPGWVIRSSVTLEAQYGDGTKSTIRTENSSPSDAWRAVDGAIMFAVTRLLRDEQFLAYVNR